MDTRIEPNTYAHQLAIALAKAGLYGSFVYTPHSAAIRAIVYREAVCSPFQAAKRLVENVDKAKNYRIKGAPFSLGDDSPNAVRIEFDYRRQSVTGILLTSFGKVTVPELEHIDTHIVSATMQPGGDIKAVTQKADVEARRILTLLDQCKIKL